jgi:hypothetical protein
VHFPTFSQDKKTAECFVRLAASTARMNKPREFSAQIAGYRESFLIIMQEFSGKNADRST